MRDKSFLDFTDETDYVLKKRFKRFEISPSAYDEEIALHSRHMTPPKSKYISSNVSNSKEEMEVDREIEATGKQYYEKVGQPKTNVDQ